MKNYTFTVYLGGLGETPEEAWKDVIENFMLEPGPAPETYEVEEDENWDEDE